MSAKVGWGRAPGARPAIEIQPETQHPPPDPVGRGYRLTSSSLSLNTKFFSLDLSWKRVESGLVSRRHPGPLPDADRAWGPEPARAAPGFEEIIRRKRLAVLLGPPPPAPSDLTPLRPPEEFPPPPAACVCRAYARVGRQPPPSPFPAPAGPQASRQPQAGPYLLVLDEPDPDRGD
jgi:hypothetical protein